MYDAALAELGHEMACAVPGEAHIQLFVTPGGTHGFGWHYDSEKVFIVQTDGAKDYYFRSNTIEPESANTGSDFSRFREETSQIGMARLNSRRLVVYPARWWHVPNASKTRYPSLSASLAATEGTGHEPQSATPRLTVGD